MIDKLCKFFAIVLGVLVAISAFVLFIVGCFYCIRFTIEHSPSLAVTCLFGAFFSVALCGLAVSIVADLVPKRKRK